MALTSHVQFAISPISPYNPDKWVSLSPTHANSNDTETVNPAMPIWHAIGKQFYHVSYLTQTCDVWWLGSQSLNEDTKVNSNMVVRNDFSVFSE